MKIMYLDKFLYASSVDNMVHRFTYQEAYCINQGIQQLLDYDPCPPLPVAEAVLITYGGNWYIRLTFTACCVACNGWVINLWDADSAIVAAYSFTVDCSHLPYTVDIRVFPSGSGRYAFTYEYQLTSCCGVTTPVLSVSL